VPSRDSANRCMGEWPTQSTDQRITVEILKRHCQTFGYVTMLERVEEVGEEKGGKFAATFPLWQAELHRRFEDLYGPERGPDVFEKSLMWAFHDLFGRHVAITIE
jgi:hypothetical protein